MNGIDQTIGIIIGIAVLIVVVILIIYYGASKLADKVDTSLDKKLAAKRDAEEQPLPVEGVTEGKEKLGIIISNLEGLFTEDDSFWKTISTEIGIPSGDEMLLSEKIPEKANYPKSIKKIYSSWKQLAKVSPSKLNKQFFSDFYNKYLRLREGAKEFIEYCEKDYDYYVISEAPWEFCLLAKEQLGFYHYYAITIFPFDRNNQLTTIIAHENGFQTEKIMAEIIRSSKFSVKETVVISNSERDINMAKQAGFGILVGRNMPAVSNESALNPNIISLSDLNFGELRTKIDGITESIKQAKNLALEKAE